MVLGSYSRLSQTWDEPTHIAAGMEWLQLHRYRMQTENPPLSRVPFAVLPFAAGQRIDPEESNATNAGNSLLYGSGDYLENLTRARLPNLAVFWLTLAMTWTLSGGISDPRVAGIATALVATSPAIVAHSGLATTDMPFVLTFLLTVWRWKALLIAPSRSNAAWLGLVGGVVLATKFSAVPFVPPVCIALLAVYAWTGLLPGQWRSPSFAMQQTALAAFVAGLTVWASYGFSVGGLYELPERFGVASWFAGGSHVRVPAPEFFNGLLVLQAHTKAGHLSYMLGQTSMRGFWLYYPFSLAIKTPLPTIVLFLVGGLFAVRASRTPESVGYLLGAAGLLLAAATSPINIGLRHVLPVYPLLCMASASGLVRFSQRAGAGARLIVTGALLAIAFQAVELGASFPQQLAYTNRLASDKPDYFIGDLEWGQDVVAMEDYFRAHPVPELYLVPNGTALFCRHDLPPLKGLPVGRQVNGWIAVFQHQFQLSEASAPPTMPKDICQPSGSSNAVATQTGWLDWLRVRRPVAVIGAGVLLFHVTDAAP